MRLAWGHPLHSTHHKVTRKRLLARKVRVHAGMGEMSTMSKQTEKKWEERRRRNSNSGH
jgi:hypothetical protein